MSLVQHLPLVVVGAAVAVPPAAQLAAAVRNGAVIRMNGLYLLGFGPRTGKAALDLHRAIYGAG